MTIDKFIASNPDCRELKRALAVKMQLEGMQHRQIQSILGIVSRYDSLLKIAPLCPRNKSD